MKIYNDSLNYSKTVYRKIMGKDIDKDSSFKKSVSKITKDATKIIKENKNNPPKMIKLLHVIIFKQIEDSFKNIKIENERDDALFLSAQTFLIVYTINTLIYKILSILLGPTTTVPIIIICVIVAPIIEEYSKKYAIENGYGDTYIKVFVVSETFIYFYDYGFTAIVVFIRFLVAIMHHGTYKLMRSTAKKDSSGNLKVNNTAFIIAILLHGFHNGMEVLQAGSTFVRTVGIGLIGAISTSIKDYKQYKNSVVTESIDPVIIPMY